MRNKEMARLRYLINSKKHPEYKKVNWSKIYKFWLDYQEVAFDFRRKMLIVNRFIEKYNMRMPKSFDVKMAVVKKVTNDLYGQRARTMNSRAKAKGDSGRVTREDLVEIMKIGGGKCKLCGSRKFIVFDHIISYFNGGSNIKNNLQLLCRMCNMKKGVL